MPEPRPRVLLLHGDHEGGASAGAIPGESARLANQARACTGPLARLAAEIGASLQVVDVAAAAPIEHGPAMPATAVDSALRFGWRLAEEAVDDGVDVLVLASEGVRTTPETLVRGLATGLVPIASRLPVYEELLADGEYGDAFEPGDAQTLAAAGQHAALNVANAIGAWLGGVVIAAGLGWTAPALVGALLAVLGLGVLTASTALERRTGDDPEPVPVVSGRATSG